MSFIKVINCSHLHGFKLCPFCGRKLKNLFFFFKYIFFYNLQHPTSIARDWTARVSLLECHPAHTAPDSTSPSGLWAYTRVALYPGQGKLPQHLATSALIAQKQYWNYKYLRHIAKHSSSSINWTQFKETLSPPEICMKATTDRRCFDDIKEVMHCWPYAWITVLLHLHATFVLDSTDENDCFPQLCKHMSVSILLIILIVVGGLYIYIRRKCNKDLGNKSDLFWI